MRRLTPARKRAARHTRRRTAAQADSPFRTRNRAQRARSRKRHRTSDQSGSPRRSSSMRSRQEPSPHESLQQGGPWTWCRSGSRTTRAYCENHNENGNDGTRTRDLRRARWTATGESAPRCTHHFTHQSLSPSGPERPETAWLSNGPNWSSFKPRDHGSLPASHDSQLEASRPSAPVDPRRRT
jgi:hypothetical protein